MIGTLLMERYRLEEQIGEGGMASVYRALDLRTGHRVAVKFLRQELQENPEFLERFRREATAASRMSHHNIVNLLDIGDSASAPYLVFEYVDGKTLKEIITEHGNLPQGTAVQIAIRILSALRHAHEAGVIHRDIKPQNILVDKQGYIKVSDFGIARMVGTHTAETDMKQSLMGSVHYFSPEQARGETATFASDLYSVGVVLYEMLTGKVPFEGETPLAVAMQHIQVDPHPLRESRPEVSVPVENVVKKAMSKNPTERYGSALFMAQALHAALLPEKENLVETSNTGVSSRQTGRDRIIRRSGRGSRATVLLLGLFLLSVIIFGVFFIYRDIVKSTRAPLLTGLMLDQALREAERESILIQVKRTSSEKPVDTVLSQSHDIGTPLRQDHDVVLIIVSSGPATKPVPDVQGKQLSAVTQLLERIALNAMVVGSPEINPAPKGTVLKQDPVPGTMMNAGGIVKLSISAGQSTVPDLSGMNRSETSTALSLAKLKAEFIEVAVLDRNLDGRVASQLPQAGEQVAEGVVITVSIYSYQPSTSPSPSTSQGGS